MSLALRKKIWELRRLADEMEKELLEMTKPRLPVEKLPEIEAVLIDPMEEDLPDIDIELIEEALGPEPKRKAFVFDNPSFEKDIGDAIAKLLESAP